MPAGTTTHPAPATSAAPELRPTAATELRPGAAAEPSRPATVTRIVTGLTPSGRLHLGNYLGAIRPLLALAARPGHETVAFVSDLHALTLEHDPTELAARTRELATTLLACGLDERCTLFRQSAVPAHTELSHLLESVATHGELARMIQFKEKSARQESVRTSLLTYPVLMAADILLYGADAVPVGQDQQQHLELTRTLAERFNARYGPVFTVPRGEYPPVAARVKDLRNPAAKMGKSTAGPGTLYLLDPPVRIAAAIRGAVTDLDPALDYDPGLRPGVANLAEILGALTGRTPAAALHGLHGAGSLKQAVTEALVATLTPLQQRYRELSADPATVDAILADGARRASALAAPRLAAARVALGLE